jgi:serine phosphatase RsbU (regulator of sigma subunit)/anti-sigma regulatory factor (Ser/Thr protein kinase)
MAEIININLELVTLLSKIGQAFFGQPVHYFANAPIPPAFGCVVYAQGSYLGWLSVLRPLTQTEQQQLQSLADLLGQVLVAEQANGNLAEQLLTAWSQLTFLYQVRETIAKTADVWQVFGELVEPIRTSFQAHEALIAQQMENGVRFITTASDLPESEIQILLRKILAKADIVLATTPAECQPWVPDLPLQMLFCSPVHTHHCPPAILAVFNYRRLNKSTATPLTAGHRKLLQAVAEQFGALLDNASLQTQKAISAQLHQEIAIAASIQTNLLPVTLPQGPSYHFAAQNIPAAWVAGDFYDWVALPDGRLVIAVADVVGKGISAALLTTTLRAVLRSQLAHIQAPSAVLDCTNQVLYPDLNRVDRFATLFFGLFDPVARTFCYANAGHPPALWCRAGQVSTLPATALPIGILADTQFESRQIALQPKDTLCFYTDGLTESENVVGESLGIAGLESIFALVAELPATIVHGFIANALRVFCQNHAPADDQTLLIFQLAPQPDFLTQQLFCFELQLRQLANLRIEFASFIAKQHPDLVGSNWYYEAELGLQELLTNLHRHAYGEQNAWVSGCFTLTPNALQIDTLDAGAPWQLQSDLQMATGALELAEGGYGLPLIKTIFEQVAYQRLPCQLNHWQLSKLM